MNVSTFADVFAAMDCPLPKDLCQIVFAYMYAPRRALCNRINASRCNCFATSRARRFRNMMERWHLPSCPTYMIFQVHRVYWWRQDGEFLTVAKRRDLVE